MEPTRLITDIELAKLRAEKAKLERTRELMKKAQEQGEQLAA